MGKSLGKTKKERRDQRQERGAAPHQEQVTGTAGQATSTATDMPPASQKKRGRKFGHN